MTPILIGGIALGSALGGFPLAEDQYAVFLEKGLRELIHIWQQELLSEGQRVKFLLN